MVILIIVVVLGAVAFALVKGMGGTGTKLTRAEAIQKVSGWKWIELADSQFKPLLRGRLLRITEDGMAVGIGVLLEKNAPSQMVTDLKGKQTIQTVAPGEILGKFMIDLEGTNFITELTDAGLKSRIEPHLGDPSKILSRFYLSSVELSFIEDSDEQQKFDGMWNARSR